MKKLISILCVLTLLLASGLPNNSVEARENDVSYIHAFLLKQASIQFRNSRSTGTYTIPNSSTIPLADVQAGCAGVIGEAVNNNYAWDLGYKKGTLTILSKTLANDNYKIKVNYSIDPGASKRLLDMVTDLNDAYRATGIISKDNLFTREKKIYDYTRDHVTYKAGVPFQHSAYSALHNGKGVCDAYAKMFSLLCEKAGVTCKLVYGTLGANKVPHCWNVVCFNNKWYNVDVTSESTKKSVYKYLYFNAPNSYLDDHVMNQQYADAYDCVYSDYYQVTDRYIKALARYLGVSLYPSEQSFKNWLTAWVSTKSTNSVRVLCPKAVVDNLKSILDDIPLDGITYTVYDKNGDHCSFVMIQFKTTPITVQ